MSLFHQGLNSNSRLYLLYAIGACLFMGSSLVIRAKESGSILVTTFLISIGFLIVGSIFFALKVFQHKKKGEVIKLPWINNDGTFNAWIFTIIFVGGLIEFGGSLILSSSFYFAGKAHLN